MNNRPSWDVIWIEMAHSIARRSIDDNFKVGCIIVSCDNQQVLSLGYNGMERGGSNVVESTEPGKTGCIHAENNALLKLDYNNTKRRKAYVTLFPCRACCRLLVNADIHEVIYDTPYRDMSGLDILQHANIDVRRFAHSDVDI